MSVFLRWAFCCSFRVKYFILLILILFSLFYAVNNCNKYEVVIGLNRLNESSVCFSGGSELHCTSSCFIHPNDSCSTQCISCPAVAAAATMMRRLIRAWPTIALHSRLICQCVASPVHCSRKNRWPTLRRHVTISHGQIPEDMTDFGRILSNTFKHLIVTKLETRFRLQFHDLRRLRIVL